MVLSTPVLNGLYGAMHGKAFQASAVVRRDLTLSSWLQDEISTGLDSSTTFLITKCIRNFVHMQDVRVPKLAPSVLKSPPVDSVR